MEKNNLKFTLWKLAFISLAVMAILAACRGSGEQTEATPPLETPLAAVTEIMESADLLAAYPPPTETQPATSETQPATSEASAYPPPVETEPATPETSPYPGPDQTPVAVAMTPAPTLNASASPIPTETPSQPASPTKEVKKELVATDPTTVQLASGKIQLVEFFAFW